MQKDRKNKEILRDDWGEVLWLGEVGGSMLCLVLLAVVLVLWLAGVVGVLEGRLETENEVPLPTGVVVALTEVLLRAGVVARDEAAGWADSVAGVMEGLVARDEVAWRTGVVASVVAGLAVWDEVAG